MEVVRSIEKRCESVFGPMLQKSVMASQCHCCSPLQCWCHITLSFPPWKIRPLRCGLLSNFFDHLSYLSDCDIMVALWNCRLLLHRRRHYRNSYISLLVESVGIEVQESIKSQNAQAVCIIYTAYYPELMIWTHHLWML